MPAVPGWLYRGFEAQEEMTVFALINFNGRIYDPVQGRMISPDIFVQFPYYSQGFNKYSYVLNNPLMFIDPSGYKTEKEKHTTLADVTVVASPEDDNEDWNFYLYIWSLSGYGGEGNGGGYGNFGGGGGGGGATHWLPDVRVYAKPAKTKKNTTNPNTIRNNYFGSNYIGPNNPKYTDGTWSYELQPINKLDFYAKQHDMAYDKAGASGIKGVLFSTKVIGADYKLVGNSFVYTIDITNGATGIERVEGMTVSVVIGILVLPKTIFYINEKLDEGANPFQKTIR